MLVRSEVSMKADGDLPRDYITNTVYHTINDSGFNPSTDFQNHADQVRDCFNGTSAGYTAYSLSKLRGIQVKVYDMADALPRAPKATSVNDKWVTGATTGPNGASQIALCLSYFGARNLKHQRGRIYIGPFNPSDLTQRPTDYVLNNLLVLGHALFDVGGENVALVLYRPTTHDSTPITTFWVDDAWDVQRRRQIKASKRVTLAP